MNATARLTPIAAYALVGAGALLMLAPFYFMFVFATSSTCRRRCGSATTCWPT
jgi:multiple sugar transport system permease protein